MASTLRKCIDLAPTNRVDIADARPHWVETRTPWVVIWAQWDLIEPNQGDFRFADLDSDIQNARNTIVPNGGINDDRLNIILKLWKFPRWANGTSGPEWQPGASADQASQPDRFNPDSRTVKPLEFRVAADLTTTSPWANFIRMLMTRYRGWIDFLDVVNEPNLQLWPQQDSAGNVTIHRPVAQMFKTAQTIRDNIVPGGTQTPILLGPGTDDSFFTGQPRLRTVVPRFMDLFLPELNRIGFVPGRKFGWSHHNYTDVESNLTGTENRAAFVRNRLVSNWAGWPDGLASNPYVMLTEGGARLTRIGDGSTSLANKQRQATLLQNNYDRNHRNDGDGAGIGIVTTYQMHTTTDFDSGLREVRQPPPAPDGAARPAYTTWQALPPR
jgi:hypothetical protein